MRRFAASVAFVALVALGVGGAHGDALAQGADSFMQSGRAALAANDLDAADRHFMAAHAVGAGTPALFNLGLVASRRGNCGAVAFYFARVLVDSPSDPDRPLLEREIAKCEKKLPSSYGTLQIDTKPAGAEVAVRVGATFGHPSGVHDLWLTAPVTVRLPPGRYAVLARKDRYLALQTGEDVTAGQVSSRVLSLSRAPSELLPVMDPIAPPQIDLTPASAKVVEQPPIVVEEATPHGPLMPWGWTAVGVGVAALGAGAALDFVGADKMQTANDDHVAGTPAYVDLYNEGRGLYNAGIGLYVTGGALIAGGIVMLVLDEPEAPAAAVFPMALPDGGGLSAMARF